MIHLIRYSFVFTAIALTTSPVAAQYAPWCFYDSGRDDSGAVTCTFYSFEQCMETARGIGGSCSPNPYPAAGQELKKRKRPR